MRSLLTLSFALSFLTFAQANANTQFIYSCELKQTGFKPFTLEKNITSEVENGEDYEMIGQFGNYVFKTFTFGEHLYSVTLLNLNREIVSTARVIGGLAQGHPFFIDHFSEGEAKATLQCVIETR